MAELSYRRHRFPPVVIQHAVWLYLRFKLRYRDVEDLLSERGLDISYETVRSWVLKFGPVIARRLRRRRASRFDRFILGRRRELRFDSGLLQRGVSNEPCGCPRVARGWDPEFESALLQERVYCEPGSAAIGSPCEAPLTCRSPPTPAGGGLFASGSERVN
jgi:hypothetical protein